MTAVSIVVPSRGGAGRLPVLLDSLVAQTSADFEIVVVLDGDVDDSAGVLAARDDLPLRIVVLPQNQGRSSALNAGFAVAEGDVLVRCDDDLEPGLNYVAEHAIAHRDEPVGIIGIYRNQLPDTPYARVYGRDADRRLRDGAYAAGQRLTWRYWAGNASVTRETWDRIGGYDADVFSRYGWEDVDWGYRLHQAGVPIRLVAQLETPHHVAATTTAVRAARAFDSGWSQLLFETKHQLVVEDKAAAPRTAWQRLVARASRDLDHDLIRRRGDRIDRSLRVLPRAIARKRIALLVEASARAGYRQAISNPEGTLP